MKKLLLFALMISCLAFAGKSQSLINSGAVTLTWSGYGNTLDTVTNTGTKYATVTLGNTASKAFNFLVKVTKISGTVGGTIAWQGSNDGTNFVNISTASPSDASANYTYAIYTTHTYKYYRVSWTGTGTMSASIAGTANVIR